MASKKLNATVAVRLPRGTSVSVLLHKVCQRHCLDASRAVLTRLGVRLRGDELVDDLEGEQLSLQGGLASADEEEENPDLLHCKSCHNLLLGMAYRALGNHRFHESCAECNYCHKAVTKGMQYQLPTKRPNKIYCSGCSNRIFA